MNNEINAIGIIPARMSSSRFPGKPLKKIHGMPMVGHCYHRSVIALGAKNVYVATCDREIFDYILSIGGNAIMTASTHTRATGRTAEALEIIENNTNNRADVVVMVQGDEPLIQPKSISQTLAYFCENNIDVVNIMSTLETRDSFEDKNNVKVVVDCNNDALYFSREPIPSAWINWSDFPRYMQTGVIAFRRDMLLQFNSIEETWLERLESVDMNRILEIGGKIHMLLSDSIMIGVDVPEELSTVEDMLIGDEIMKKYLQ